MSDPTQIQVTPPVASTQIVTRANLTADQVVTLLSMFDLPTLPAAAKLMINGSATLGSTGRLTFICQAPTP